MYGPPEPEWNISTRDWIVSRMREFGWEEDGRALQMLMEGPEYISMLDYVPNWPIRYAWQAAVYIEMYFANIARTVEWWLRRAHDTLSQARRAGRGPNPRKVRKYNHSTFAMLKRTI